MGQSRKKRRASVGVLFWVAVILLVAVIFLANRTNIQNVLESTGLVTVIQDEFGIGEEGAPTVEQRNSEGGGDPEDDDADNDGDGSGSSSEGAAGGNGSGNGSGDGRADESDGGNNGGGVRGGESGGSEVGSQDATDSVLEEDGSDEGETIVVTPDDTGTEAQGSGANGGSAESAANSSSGSASGGETGSGSSSSESVASVPADQRGGPVRERDAEIYFIRVTDDGAIHPERVTRTIEYVNAPMTATLETLLSGPTAQELSLGLLNLIPDSTELLSARVEDGVAYLNFNEAFRFNSMGAEGLIAQLQQIVFSCTEFSTVDKVQILIEGQRIEYLGEGIYTGGPIGRDQFS